MNNLVIPDSVDNAAKNLSDKPTQAIGQTFADLWQLTLGGRVSYAVEKQKLRYAHALEEYRKTLEEKVDSIPASKQVAPSLQVAAQALEDSKYCIESKELRELFANLIARAMHSDYSDTIHPSFSKIAQQLSPFDAQMLVLMRDHHVHGGIAVVDYIRNEKDNGYNVIMECVPAFVPGPCPVAVASRSLVSLQRLGLIEIPSDMYFIDDDHYKSFLSTTLYEELTEEYTSGAYTVDIKKRIAKLTLMGQDFVNVCLD